MIANLSLLTLSFLSITQIVQTISDISKLLKNPDKNFLLFILISKAQKSNSNREL
jgi:hypothetical protein